MRNKTDNQLIDGDNGSNCQSPYHVCNSNCDHSPKVNRLCKLCLEELNENEIGFCAYCYENRKEYGYL